MVSILTKIQFTVNKLTKFYHLGGFIENLDQSGAKILSSFSKIPEYVKVDLPIIVLLFSGDIGSAGGDATSEGESKSIP